MIKKILLLLMAYVVNYMGMNQIEKQFNYSENNYGGISIKNSFNFQ